MKPHKVGGLLRAAKVVYVYVALAEKPDPDIAPEATPELLLLEEWMEISKAQARKLVNAVKEEGYGDGEMVAAYEEKEKALYIGGPEDMIETGEEILEEEEDDVNPALDDRAGLEEDGADEEELDEEDAEEEEEASP